MTSDDTFGIQIIYVMLLILTYTNIKYKIIQKI